MAHYPSQDSWRNKAKSVSTARAKNVSQQFVFFFFCSLAKYRMFELQGLKNFSYVDDFSHESIDIKIVQVLRREFSFFLILFFHFLILIAV